VTIDSGGNFIDCTVINGNGALHQFKSLITPEGFSFEVLYTLAEAVRDYQNERRTYP
jgi:hypothetical protein